METNIDLIDQTRNVAKKPLGLQAQLNQAHNKIVVLESRLRVAQRKAPTIGANEIYQENSRLRLENESLKKQIQLLSIIND